MNLTSWTTAIFLVTAISTNAMSAGLHVMHPLGGYTCKMLNISEREAMSPTPVVHVKSSPSDEASDIGWAPLTVAVKDPQTSRNGYLEMKTLAGKTGWIAQSFVTDWHSKAQPSATCYPAVMSNGHLGFGYRH